MEQDIVKPEAGETLLTQKSYPIAPAHYLNYVEKITIENMTKVSVPHIKRLAKNISPNVHSQIQDFADYQTQELREKLLFINDTNFLDALCTVIFVCSDKGIDMLERCGIDVNIEHQHQGEQVVSAYINHSDKFEIALNHLLLKSVTTDKTYHIFKSRLRVPQIEDLKSSIQSIENEFKKYFENSRYGRFCQFRLLCPIKGDNRLGFFVEHGSNLKSKVIIDPQDKIVPFLGRNLVGDLVIYDLSLELVFISSRSEKHYKFYSRMLGKIFWNNENLFDAQARLDLSVIKKANAQLLESCRTTKIILVQLKKIHTSIDDTKSLETTRSIRKGCLICDTDQLKIEGDITEMTMALKLNLNGKNRLQRLVLRPTSIKYGPLISQFDIRHIFNRLRLIENENNKKYI